MTEFQPKPQTPEQVDEGLRDAMKQAKLEGVFKIPTDSIKINVPKQSNWTCYMFGNRPNANYGIAYTPAEGRVPNRFVRWMMRICFDCMWVEAK
jgi:hypothetical protein